MLRARSVALGDSHVTVIHARELVDFAVQMLRYLPEFLLGETIGCRERRQLCASSAPAQYQSAETKRPGEKGRLIIQRPTR